MSETDPATGQLGSTTSVLTADRRIPEVTRAHKAILAGVAAGSLLVAGIGFTGSYHAVAELARTEGFGKFSNAFPIGIDAGIGVLLSLDLVLTWFRIPLPLLRHFAWLLTAATIAFNAATSWPHPLGVSMHAVIPTLFIVVVEAARHAVGRLADITADADYENPPLIRWILSPVPTYRIWRRMRLWNLRSYTLVVGLERQRREYKVRLRVEHGRGWRRHASERARLALALSRFGTAVRDTLAEERAADLAAAGPDRTAVVDRLDPAYLDRSGPDREDAVRTVEAGPDRPELPGPDRTAWTADPGPDQEQRTGPDRHERTEATPDRTVRAERTAPVDRTVPSERTADRTAVDLVLNETEQEAVDLLRSTGRSISKRSIADVVRNELGRSIGSDRAAEIARHFRTLRSAA